MTTVTIAIEQTPAGLKVERTTSKQDETYLEDWYTTVLLALLDEHEDNLANGRSPQ